MTDPRAARAREASGAASRKRAGFDPRELWEAEKHAAVQRFLDYLKENQ